MTLHRLSKSPGQSTAAKAVCLSLPLRYVTRLINVWPLLTHLQITCLFWFESSAVLELAEDPSSTALSPQPLFADALPTTGFRKWVTTILSTTQVAQNVILLALLFIYRLKKQNPSVKGKPGSEYRLLTVALMLGNKFLDDNTYTNKTWAEVSGISVAEVHIMEVEFLSNMKYALFTSAAEWTKWQTLLGRFAGFVERATRPPVAPTPVSLPMPMPYLPSALPSPPNSFQASPFSAAQTPVYGSQPYSVASHGPTSRPSPLAYALEFASQNTRKRSLDDDAVEPAPKRPAYNANVYSHQHNLSSSSSSGSAKSHAQSLPRVNLASMSNNPQSARTYTPLPLHQPQNYAATQLPPLNYPLKAMSLAYPPITYPPSSTLSTPLTNPAQHAMALNSTQPSRHQSPYVESRNVSPTDGSFRQPSQAGTQGQASPSVFLAQRNSPYKPVMGVSKLLVPPPPRAMQQPENVGRDQMHYQPLGRPFNERQQGRLPYLDQNQWVDPSHQKATTPTNPWPAFLHTQHSRQSTPMTHYG